MRRWLVGGALVCLVAVGVWLALRSQRRAAAPTARSPARIVVPPSLRHQGRPARLRPADPAADPGATTDQPRPRAGRSMAPQFDPFLDQLAEAALAGNLEKAAAENGITLKGDQVRVVIRPTLGDGEKVRDAVRNLGGEVVRTIERGAEPTLVAWVPARSLRTLAENPSVRNLHRPVGIHASEPAGRKKVDPNAPQPAPGPPPIR